jgi:hypothetical protein
MEKLKKEADEYLRISIKTLRAQNDKMQMREAIVENIRMFCGCAICILYLRPHGHCFYKATHLFFSQMI